jgi:hypothetical protein
MAPFATKSKTLVSNGLYVASSSLRRAAGPAAMANKGARLDTEM